MPRLSTPPLRDLTDPANTRGHSLVQFAATFGMPLLPWQGTAALAGLETNPDGTYRYQTVVILVGRQSGKTSLLKVWALWRMYVDDARLVVGAAQSLDISREAWMGSVDLALANPELEDEVSKVRYANGEQCLTLHNGARYRIAATTPGAGRGLSVDLLVMDEVRQLQNWVSWSALSKTTLARPKGQTVCISNAGTDESVVLNSLREKALGGEETIGLFEWSADPALPIEDPESWAQGCPGVGHLIPEKAIKAALGTDPAAVFRTEIRCERVTSMQGACDVGGWAVGADPAGSIGPYRGALTAGIEVAMDGHHVALVAAVELPDGRVRVEPVASWNSTEAARGELTTILAQLNPVVLAWFPGGPSAPLAPLLEPLPYARGLKGLDATAACMGFADLIQAGRVVHNSNPLLDGQVAAAVKVPQGDGWRFGRRTTGSCNALYAGAGAVYTALSVVAPKPKWSGALVGF